MPKAEEPLFAEAQALLARHVSGEIGALVPDLFWPELASVLAKAVRRGRLDGAEAPTAYASVRAIRLATVATEDIAAPALELAMRWQHSAYDMVYAALAARLGATLVTADERLVRAVGAWLPVRWLGTYAD